MRNEVNPSDISEEQRTTLTFLFEYEKRGPFLIARLGPDEPPTAVFGDWGYWETCRHCWLPLMGEHGKGL